MNLQTGSGQTTRQRLKVALEARLQLMGAEERWGFRLVSALRGKRQQLAQAAPTVEVWEYGDGSSMPTTGPGGTATSMMQLGHSRRDVMVRLAPQPVIPAVSNGSIVFRGGWEILGPSLILQRSSGPNGALLFLLPSDERWPPFPPILTPHRCTASHRAHFCWRARNQRQKGGGLGCE